jgi:hypothetical protein
MNWLPVLVLTAMTEVEAPRLQVLCKRPEARNVCALTQTSDVMQWLN